MKIARASLSTFTVTGPAPREAILVLLHDESGRVGVGEAAPLAGFSRDTFDQAVKALHAASTQIGEMDDGGPTHRALHAALLPCREALRGSPSARFALETALFDLAAQRRGTDVASCLRAISSGIFGQPAPQSDRSMVESSALLLGASDPQALVKAGFSAVARGFRTLKVKLRATDDISLEREIEGLLALRYAVPDVEIRLDPNGRWSVDEARRFMARLAPLAPIFVEQPVDPRALHELGPCAVPWAADESLADVCATSFPCVCASPCCANSPCDRGDSNSVPHLSSDAGCGAFILKPAALGLFGAMSCAALAARRGLPVVVTHFMDGPVGLAAACELSLSLSPPPLACGLDPHAGLSDLDPSALPHHVQPARVRATGLPGLGFTAEALASLLEHTAPVWTQ